MKGTVKFFNVVKGFGFIAGEDGKEYFVHQTGLKEGAKITENDTVTFDVEKGDRGPKAVNVSTAEAGEETEEKSDEDFEEKSEKPKEKATKKATLKKAA